MKAPLSWIREYVDLPADVTLSVLTDKLTMLGLKLEAITNPADAITGPLVLGRVLTIEKEPQKNGKTINWCTVDVADANGTGEPQGIVCGAHNFVEGDLVVVCLPGAVLPGNFEISARKTYGHLSAGMICSAAELGLGTDHDGIIVLPADAGAPGDNAFDVLGMDDPVIEFEINPDRAYALSLRGIAREAALGFGLPFTDPAARATPAADEAGYPVVVDDTEACPVFVARTVSGFDPTAQTPAWMATRLEQAGMRPISLGVDISNYVMLELGQPNHCYDRAKLAGPITRASRGGGGEDHHPRQRRAHADRRRPADLATTTVRSASPASWAARTPSCPRPRPRSSSRPRTSTRSPSSGPASATSCTPRRPSASSAASTRCCRRPPPTASSSCSSSSVARRPTPA